MRFLVFALIFANLLFFAYSRAYFGTPVVSPDAKRMEGQIYPESIQLLERSGEIIAQAQPFAETRPVNGSLVTPAENTSESREMALATGTSAPLERNMRPAPPPVATRFPERPATPSTPTTVATPPGESAEEMTACVLFSTPQAETAGQLADRALATGLSVTRRSESGWWVFIPPQADRNTAVKKANELRALGVTEFFIVNDGPQQFAISLGVFSSEEAAQSHLAQLRSKGVRSAQAGPRNAGKGRQQLEVKGEVIAVVAFRANAPEGVSSRDCP